MRLLKRVRLFRAAAKIQKYVRRNKEQKEFKLVRQTIVELQKNARAFLCYKEYQPKIKAAIEERKRMMAEMAEAQKAELEMAKKQAQERSKNKQEARKRHVEAEKESSKLAVVGKSLLECELLLSTTTPMTEFHRLPVVNAFKDTLCDVVQTKPEEVFLLSVKSGEGTVILKLRFVVPTDDEEERSDLLHSAVDEQILAKSWSQKGYETDSISFAVKLKLTTVTEEFEQSAVGNAAAGGGGGGGGGGAAAVVDEMDADQKAMLLERMQQMQQMQQQGTSEIKDARLELRLRTLEREVKELKTALEEEQGERTKMEKQVKEMQRQMIKQMTLITNLMQPSAVNHHGQLKPAGLNGRSAAAAGTVGASAPLVATGTPLNQKPNPVQRQPQAPQQAARSRVAAPAAQAAQGSTTPADDLIGHSAKMLEAATAPTPPPMTNQSSAFDILSSLRSSAKQAPKPKVIAREAQPVNIAAIKRLQTSVARCKQHFNQPLPPGYSRHTLGNDSANKEIGRLIRGELCTALAMVFLNGFKSFKFVGRYHIWDFFEKCAEFSTANDKAKRSIAEGVLAVKGMDEYMKGKNDLKFRAFICYALNQGCLHKWISALDPDDPLMQKWYEAWSFLRNETAREMIINGLEPLAEDHYELALDYELAMWDL